MDPIIIWILVAIAFGIVEGLTLGLTAVWFMAAAFVTLIPASLGADIPIQIVVFLVSSLCFIGLAKPIVKKHFNNKIENFTTDTLCGKEGIVTKDISAEDYGEIKIGDITYRAKAESDIPEKTKVIVKEVRGVSLIVERIKE